MSGSGPQHLIIGGDGQLGRALLQDLAARGEQVCSTTRRQSSPTNGRLPLDLAQPDAVRRFAWPEGVIRVYLLAAVTALRTCRESPEPSRFVNVTQTTELAKRAQAYGAAPVLVSTNLVFDGSRPTRKPNDPPCPTSNYGRHKAEAEQAVLSRGGAVVRPTKVLPPEERRLAGWRDALRRGEPVEAFGDLMFAPVPMSAVIDAVIDAALGVTHVSADRDISYADAARHIARRLGAGEELVREASATDAGIPPEERPRHTTLACEGRFDPFAVIDVALGLDDLARRG